MMMLITMKVQIHICDYHSPSSFWWPSRWLVTTCWIARRTSEKKYIIYYIAYHIEVTSNHFLDCKKNHVNGISCGFTRIIEDCCFREHLNRIHMFADYYCNWRHLNGIQAWRTIVAAHGVEDSLNLSNLHRLRSIVVVMTAMVVKMYTEVVSVTTAMVVMM